MKLLLQFVLVIAISGVFQATHFNTVLKYTPDYVYSFWKYVQGTRVNVSYLDIPKGLMVFLDYELNHDNSRIKLFWITNETSKESSKTISTRYSNNMFWTFDIANSFESINAEIYNVTSTHNYQNCHNQCSSNPKSSCMAIKFSKGVCEFLKASTSKTKCGPNETCLRLIKEYQESFEMDYKNSKKFCYTVLINNVQSVNAVCPHLRLNSSVKSVINQGSNTTTVKITTKITPVTTPINSSKNTLKNKNSEFNLTTNNDVDTSTILPSEPKYANKNSSQITSSNSSDFVVNKSILELINTNIVIVNDSLRMETIEITTTKIKKITSINKFMLKITSPYLKSLSTSQLNNNEKNTLCSTRILETLTSRFPSTTKNVSTTQYYMEKLFTDEVTTTKVTKTNPQNIKSMIKSSFSNISSLSHATPKLLDDHSNSTFSNFILKLIKSQETNWTLIDEEVHSISWTNGDQYTKSDLLFLNKLLGLLFGRIQFKYYKENDDTFWYLKNTEKLYGLVWNLSIIRQDDNQLRIETDSTTIDNQKFSTQYQILLMFTKDNLLQIRLSVKNIIITLKYVKED